MTFANSLDPDQARQNIGHVLGPQLFDTPKVFLKELSKKLIQTTKKHENFPGGKELIVNAYVIIILTYPACIANGNV